MIFVHLSGPREQIEQRLTARLDHYMPASLLDSQIATLEAPGSDENALIVDTGGPPAQQVRDILRRLRLPRLSCSAEQRPALNSA